MSIASRFKRWRSGADEPFPAAWHDVVQHRLGAWPNLSAEQQTRLEDLTARLVTEKRWEAARDFELTDDIRVTIAAHAALLILEIGYEAYRDITSIIVHPTTILLTGEQAGPIPGSRTDDPLQLLGQAQYRGPVLIAWDAALAQARHPERGHNVVFHEFAHRLDMLDGMVDGMPLLPDEATRQSWIDVCTAEFTAVRDGPPDKLLSDYAAVSPAEFFAVVTEVFFNRPTAMRHHKPALYAVLSGFYRQDPAASQRPKH